MPDLSLCRTDSKASRNIVFCVPVSAYAFDSRHLNLTLQMLLEAVVEDLKTLGQVGVPTKEHGVFWLLCNSIFSERTLVVGAWESNNGMEGYSIVVHCPRSFMGIRV